jgi:biotin carboxyl carrier protein
MRYFVSLGNREYVVDLEDLGSGELRVTDLGPDGAPNAARTARLLRRGPVFLVELGERQFEIGLEINGKERVATVNGRRLPVQVRDERQQRQASTRRTSIPPSGELRCPMTGRIVRELVKTGQSVTARTPVLVVEAMKMENELSAPCDGVVGEVFAQAGSAVERGALLLRIEPEA